MEMSGKAAAQFQPVRLSRGARDRTHNLLRQRPPPAFWIVSATKPEIARCEWGPWFGDKPSGQTSGKTSS